MRTGRSGGHADGDRGERDGGRQPILEGREAEVGAIQADHSLPEPRAERRNGGACGEGHEQQEPDRDDEPEGLKPIDEKHPDLAVRRRRHPPDGVERGLQFQERAAGRDTKRDAADDNNMVVFGERAV